MVSGSQSEERGGDPQEEEVTQRRMLQRGPEKSGLLPLSFGFGDRVVTGGQGQSERCDEDRRQG